jgi:hypothetical protein
MRLSTMKAPKFRIGKCVYSEYELREIQVKVAKGELPSNLIVTQVDTKQKCRITNNGSLTDVLDGLSVVTHLMMELMREKRNKGEQ